jgi:hypothetical protein
MVANPGAQKPIAMDGLLLTMERKKRLELATYTLATQIVSFFGLLVSITLLSAEMKSAFKSRFSALQAQWST